MNSIMVSVGAGYESVGVVAITGRPVAPTKGTAGRSTVSGKMPITSCWLQVR